MSSSVAVDRLKTLARIALVTAAAAACTSPAAPGDPTVVPGATQTGVAGGDRARPIEKSQDGLTLRVEFDGAEVAPGATLTMRVGVRNDRPTPAILAFGTCGAPATVSAEVAVPWEPEGRAWDGIAAEFKSYALREGLAPGLVPATQPMQVYATARPFPQDASEWTLQPR